MGVATWLVIMTCFCVLQGCLGSGQQRSKFSMIAKMFRRVAKEREAKEQSDPVSRLTSQAMSNRSPSESSTVTPQKAGTDDIFNSWYKCPVLEKKLEDHFEGFPNTTLLTDSATISHEEIRQVLTTGVATFEYLKNVGVAVDLMTEDTASLVLDKRGNCTVSMYQQVFVYYMRKQLDQMMSPRDTSLKSRIDVILKDYFPNNPAILSQASELVRGVHFVVHESFIVMLQEEEFQSLGLLLRDYKFGIVYYLEQYYNGQLASIGDVTSEIVNTFFSLGTYHPGSLLCTTPQEFIDMHMRVARTTTNYYWQAHKSGLAMAFLTNHLRELFNNPHAQIPVNLDPVIVDEAIRKLVNVILDYMNDTAAELAKYEGYLASATLTPPTFMASSLSDVQWNVTMMLFNRMFHNSPTQVPTTPVTSTQVPTTDNPFGPISPGSGISPDDVVMYLQKDVKNLKGIKSQMAKHWMLDQEYIMINNKLDNMISAKESTIKVLSVDTDQFIDAGTMRVK